MSTTYAHYHAHVYFDLTQAAFAAQVRENIILGIPQLTYRGQLIPMPIGPHPKPMFELHIRGNHLSAFIANMDDLREGLSVLIHPVHDNEYLAHTLEAQWLGEALPLKLDVLK